MYERTCRPSAIFKSSACQCGVFILAIGTIAGCTPTDPPSVGETVDFGISLELVATGLDRPVDVACAPDDPTRLYVIEQPGVIRVIDLASRRVADDPFLDISDRVSGGFRGNGEQGMFSMAFHPRHGRPGDPDERHFFVHYTDTGGATTVERIRSVDAESADPVSGLVILSLEQPFSNHNGGTIAFGPDGMLYIGLGDGGSAFDPQNRAQDVNVLLGKILRVDVDGASADRPYAIPPNNPFVGRDGRDEIWAYGLRNPWRLSFDRETGDLYIGDVGQNVFEEVNFQPAGRAGGENYGWRCLEGTFCTQLSGCDCNDSSLTGPIHEYPHDILHGASITGGYVYRGTLIDSLRGWYLFADFVSGNMWALQRQDGVVARVASITAVLSSLAGAGAIEHISSFGQDVDGELYIVDRGVGDGQGRIVKIISP